MAQLARAPQKFRPGFLDVSQPLDMGDKAAAFYRELEAFGRLRAPVPVRLGFGSGKTSSSLHRAERRHNTGIVLLLSHRGKTRRPVAYFHRVPMRNFPRARFIISRQLPHRKAVHVLFSYSSPAAAPCRNPVDWRIRAVLGFQAKPPAAPVHPAPSREWCRQKIAAIELDAGSVSALPSRAPTLARAIRLPSPRSGALLQHEVVIVPAAAKQLFVILLDALAGRVRRGEIERRSPHVAQLPGRGAVHCDRREPVSEEHQLVPQDVALSRARQVK